MKELEIWIALVVLALLIFWNVMRINNHNHTPQATDDTHQASEPTPRMEQTATEGLPYYEIEMTATHYDLGECCCGRWATEGVNSQGQRVTASQALARGNIVAADTDYYPFGTKMVVRYKDGREVEYTVEDRGGKIKGPHRIDILVNSHAEGIRKGTIENLTVKVYERKDQ